MGAIWERLVNEGETAKAFKAFTLYRDMTPEDRSFRKVAEIMGYSSTTGIERWAARDKFRWVERATAYDDWRDKTKLAVVEAGIEQAHQATIINEGVEIVALQNLIQDYIKGTMGGDGTLDTLDLLRLAQVLDKLHVMRRRNLGMPSNYKTETVTEEEFERAVFTAVPDMSND